MKIKTEILDSSFKKFKGLMFSKKKNLLFKFNKPAILPIHMFFVFYPITVAWLDSDFKVLEAKKAYPFLIYIPKKKASYILELAPCKKLIVGKKINIETHINTIKYNF